MKRYRQITEWVKRAASFGLSAVLACMAVLPYLPVLPVKAEEGDQVVLTTAFGEYGGSHKLYCIDKGGMAIWGIADDGDVFERHRPSQASLPLSDREQEYVFWGILTLQASLGVKEAGDVVASIRANAGAQGKTAITNLVTEEDLKALIYSGSVRAKYPWLETVASHTEEYLELGGLLGGGGASVSGKKIPDVLAGASSLTTAYQVNRSDFTIHFDENGADADFIETVPLLFSNDNGAQFQPEPTDGWTYVKTRDSITFSNPNPQPPKALIRFAVEGTDYALAGGAYPSKEALFDECLEIWECIRCSGGHTGGTPPMSDTWIHQRMVWLELKTVEKQLFAALAGDPAAIPGEPELTFRVFRHAEDFESSYRLQLYKYDHETGKALEGARFALYERFDDRDVIDRDRDGAVHIYEGGEPYAAYHTDKPAVWDGFRNAASLITDENGYAAKTIERGYHYDKTFCDGHPAPVFIAVPEPEEDEETGEVLNSDAIEAAQAKNREAAGAWTLCAKDCGEKAGGEYSGVHFHWMMEDVDTEEIERIAASGGDPGRQPDGGNTEEPDAQTAYEESGCYEDMLQTYDKFISLRYSYAWVEFQAREGYARHDLHSGDLPVEIITTDSSQNGANAFFSGEYSSMEAMEKGGKAKQTEKLPKKAAAIVEETAEPALRRSAKEVPVVRAGRENEKDRRPFIFIDEEGPEEEEKEGERASGSEAKKPASGRPASASEAVLEEPVVREEAASASEASFVWRAAKTAFRSPGAGGREEDTGERMFPPAYEEALRAESEGARAGAGPSGNFSHCSSRDPEGNAWRIYDHRTEGEFHIRKQDLDLAGNDPEHAPAGGTQGDATLSGAVYGLFAARDIVHPDGKTGVVYRANNLVAVAATDQNGDASFVANTEAPGYIYDYARGMITEAADGWAGQAPENLYTADAVYDDYTEDGRYAREYENLAVKNKNCWIGRPLLMGEYYVKELSRSEGYELSIGNRKNPLTNRGQDTDAGAPEPGKGYAGIARPLFADGQTSDQGEGSGPNELFFSSEARDTGGRYDIVLSGLPAGAAIYRKEAGTRQAEALVGTGVYEKVFLTNPDGTPVYLKAERPFQYPKYNADGSLMKQEVLTNEAVNRFRQVSARRLQEQAVREALERADGGMTEAENLEMLEQPFTRDKLAFVKGKAEAALRRNKKATPGSRLAGGGMDYSSIYAGVFDSGVREGEPDMYGLSGVTPGNPAAFTVYGAPVQSVEALKMGDGGTRLTVREAILSVLRFYDSHPYYSYGGIDSVKETGSGFQFEVYAGVTGNPESFMALGSDAEDDSIIFRAVRFLPQDVSEPPRLVYASYSNNTAYSAFGTYGSYKEYGNPPSVLGSAVLIPAAEADGTGSLHGKTVEENVYYEPGEEVYGRDGKRIQAFEYRERLKTELVETEDVRWQKLPAVRRKDGSYVVSVETAYTDSFGASHTDEGASQTTEWKIALKEKEAVLSAGEAAMLGAGFAPGNTMDSASYYLHVKKAFAKAYLDASNGNLTGENSYLLPAELVYPGQEKTNQDAGTRKKPGHVFERVIRQRVKVVKDIQTMPDGGYAHNTNEAAGHKDSFTEGPGGKTGAGALANFRFKAYLKSNLERLYRNDNGEIVWLDQNGEETDPMGDKNRYPGQDPCADVQKRYTKAPHRADSVTVGSVNNNTSSEAVCVNPILYRIGEDGLIEAQPQTGYTRLLESVPRVMEDGAGKTRTIIAYNYEKFFDAMRTANFDKWDQKGASSTSFKPLAWILERMQGFTPGGQGKTGPEEKQGARTAAGSAALPGGGAVQNESNTSKEALKNQEATDAVRQFAVTWYLDEEVKKLTERSGDGSRQAKGGAQSYQEEAYDKALREAIQKAENYLKPFFTYDLDEIYAIEWDGEPDGGKDGDKTTLSADSSGEAQGKSCYYGVSKYLPYGIYVAVEQQPCIARLGDFYNKHYRIDQPKEIAVPSLYQTDGNRESPPAFDSFYEYGSQDTPEQLASKYLIRMNEEWAQTHTDEAERYVIRAQGNDGPFEVYKYGLDADKRTGQGALFEDGGSYQGYTFTQEEYAPYKALYHTDHPESVYHSNAAVGAYYHYASVSEQSGTEDGVLYRHGPESDANNPSGFYFKDQVKTITGALTGYDGQYFAALVPWTVTEPPGPDAYDASVFAGYADQTFRNTFYASKLRLEKLDSETGEDILHDGAIFTIYSAKREDKETEDGRVKFYEKPALITGSREFLEAMGAENITPAARAALPWEIPYNGIYFGIAPAGTPICREQEQVVLTDAYGNQTGQFEAFTTVRDGELGEGVTGGQTVGYLETPQPLGAGCYVLCEIKAPAGYARSRPVAVEIYSDEAAYYLDGNPDQRVRAAVYHERVSRTADNGEEITAPDGTESNGNKPQDRGDMARVYIDNTPLRLKVAKTKPEEQTAVFELNGRLEGSITQLKGRYGLENLELAFNDSGTYLGYAWRKGFLDALKKKKDAGEDLELLYEEGVFTGKARLTRRLESADDKNRYLPGARMTLYDAIEIKESGDKEDYRFTGVNIERDAFGNVKRMYVQKGYAGTAVKYLLDKSADAGADPEDLKRYSYSDQEDDRGEGTWIYKTVEREDTDILFYDLGNLSVLEEINGAYYGRDAYGNRVQAKAGMALFAWKNGAPFLEITCPDWEGLLYSKADRAFTEVPEGTRMYHLDADKNRDSLVEPYTGMAYVEDEEGRVLVWPVRISRDPYGNVIVREKIKTGRLASIFSDTENEYTIGTYRNGKLEKSLSPALNEHGQPVYYQKSQKIYKKGEAVYDRDRDFVRYKYDDRLRRYNTNAWEIQTSGELADIGPDPESDRDDKPLFHRRGEGYIMENTWITGEAAPNDPFSHAMTPGQADVLKRVPAGSYIMEELVPPAGYVKTMPVGLTVGEDGTAAPIARAVDWPISAYIEKVDAPENFKITVLDRDGLFDETEIRQEGKAGYSFRSVKGAELALFRARRVPSDQLSSHPFGYYLEKMEDTPAQWDVLDGENGIHTYTAQWTAGDTPAYLEAVPKGDYILEEIHTPPGYIPASKWVSISGARGLHHIALPNDHTKLEILKYEEKEGEKQALPAAAGAVLSLYEAETDSGGIVTENGVPRYKKDVRIDTWTADDCLEYTETIEVSDYEENPEKSIFARVFGQRKEETKSGFTHNFESLYAEYGPSFQEVGWKAARKAVRVSESPLVYTLDGGKRAVYRDGAFTFDADVCQEDRDAFLRQYQKNPGAGELRWLSARSARLTDAEATVGEESVRQMWETESGKQILIHISRGLNAEGKCGYNFDYKFNYQTLTYRKSPYAVSYDTAQGRRRIDYLASGTPYVLVEEKTPPGYETAPPRVVEVAQTEQIQLYGMENRKQGVEIVKTDEAGVSLAGARLALYKADPDGGFCEDGAYLAASWVSGEDGVYTEDDRKSGRIPEKQSVGSLRPHRLEGLEDGIYYLAEQEAPDGYKGFEPQRLALSGGRFEQGKAVFQAVNEKKKGVVEIVKTDAADSGLTLAEAVFELKNLDTGEHILMATGESGTARSGELETGRTVGGVWKPYRFSVKEVIPPPRYARAVTEYSFTFSDDPDQKLLLYRLEASNEPTRIEIAKTDFKSGHLVKGAVLAIYETKEENGNYTEDGPPVETWISGGGSHLVAGVLSAGGVYLLKELKAPKGYALAEPVLFSISDDGRRVSGISTGTGSVRFTASSDFPDAIERLDIWGRRAAGTRRILTDLESGGQYELTYGQSLPVRPREDEHGPDGKGGTKDRGRQEQTKQGEEPDVLEVWEGRLYEETELTFYTNGSEQTTERRIFRMKRGADGLYTPGWRLADETLLAIKDENGGALASWRVENTPGEGYQKTLYNPEYEEKRGIEVISANGKGGAAILSGSVIRYEATCKNTEKEEKGYTALVRLGNGLEWMPANSSAAWNMKGQPGVLEAETGILKPGEECRLVLTAAARPEAEGVIRCALELEGEVYEAVNPIGEAGSLTLVNRVTGTGAGSVTGRFSYRIHLRGSSGEDFTGLVPFKGSLTGRIRSGDVVSLAAGEAVTFTGLPWGTRYQIEETEETRRETEAAMHAKNSRNTEGTTGKNPESAVFFYEKRDGSRRELFTKDGTYILTEHTGYSDGTFALTGRRSFGFNGEAAPVWFDMTDAPVEILAGKTDFETGKGVSGAKMELLAQDGTLLEEWVSDGFVHQVEAVLSPGESAVLREREAPPGYGRAEDIAFTAPEEGGALRIQMEDQPVRVIVRKTEPGEKEGETDDLAGAQLTICTPDGTVVEQWVSDGTPHLVQAALLAGAAYRLEERMPMAGYAMAGPILFTVPEKGGEIVLELVNTPTRVTIRKLAVESDGTTPIGPLPGAALRIETEDGQEVCRFTTDESGSREFTGVLEAGASYRLAEESAPAGYEMSDPVTFTVPENGQGITVLMYDEKTPPQKPGRPERPGRPQTPKKPDIPVEGTLTLYYDETIEGKGDIWLRAETIPPLPKTGEGEGQGKAPLPIPEGFLITGLAAAALLLLILYTRRASDRKGERERNIRR